MSAKNAVVPVLVEKINWDFRLPLMLKGLEVVANGEELVADLVLMRSPNVYRFDMEVEVFHEQDADEERPIRIIIDDCLPEDLVPNIAITAACFESEWVNSNPTDVLLAALTEALLKHKGTRLVLEHEKDNREEQGYLLATLSIGYFKTEGRVVFTDDVLRYLRRNQSK